MAVDKAADVLLRPPGARLVIGDLPYAGHARPLDPGAADWAGRCSPARSGGPPAAHTPPPAPPTRQRSARGRCGTRTTDLAGHPHQPAVPPCATAPALAVLGGPASYWVDRAFASGPPTPMSFRLAIGHWLWQGSLQNEGRPDVQLDGELHRDHRPLLRCDEREAMLIYSMSVSVDGFIADREGGFGWTAPDEEQLRSTSAFGRPPRTSTAHSRAAVTARRRQPALRSRR